MTRSLFRLLLPLAGIAAFGTACDRNPDSDADCAGHVAGDLVITEIMNDPDGADSGKEYFEVYNATGSTITLRNWTIYLAKADGTGPKTHLIAQGEIPAGAYFVFGDSDPAGEPVEYVDYAYGTALGSMSNSSGLVGIRCNQNVIDEAKFTVPPQSGHARILSGAVPPDATQNDNEPQNWCDAQEEFAPKMFGSPGEQNEACAGGASGNCTDAVAGSRPAVAPTAGQLVITEFMADPAAVSDDVGEWLEVYATAPVDLNGVAVWSGTSKTVLSATSCLHLSTGEYALLAKNADTAVNGGLPAVRATFGVSFPNSSTAGAVLALKVGDTVIDQITYTKTTSGKASQLDAAKLDSSANDDAASFCPATTSYGAGDKGTPGAANVACPVIVPAGSCIDPGTQQARTIVAPQAGDIVINEFMANPVKADDTVGEWIELYVNSDVDLNGVQLGYEGSKTVISSSESKCMRVTAGSYLVFARSADNALNGGLPAVFGTFGFTMANSTTTGPKKIWVKAADGTTTLDEATYSTTYSTSSAGIASQLKPDKKDTVSNDDVANWCAATTPYGAGDKGTPGAENGACP